MSELPLHIVRFVAVVLLQVLVLNQVQLGGFINPFPYIYLVMTLPVNTGRVALLLYGFALGLTIDSFCGTGGIHAASTLLIAYYRPFLLKAQSPREGFELNAVPNLRLSGLGWFLGYAALLTAIHHSALFFLEVFRFNEVFRTLLKTVISGMFSLAVIFIIELFTSGERRR